MIPTKVSIWRANLEQDLDKLHDVVESKLRAALSGLHVESISVRKKTADSILQKLLTGRFETLDDIRDLLGFTIVLLYRHEIAEAITLLKQSELAIDDPGAAEVWPTDFRYHEPKVYIRPPESYFDRHPLLVQECEVQFTTALQHALDSATHDFDYKGKKYSWNNFRLVAQLRGILEMVDRTIDDIEAVEVAADHTVTTPTAMVNAEKLLNILEGHFADRLPSDRRRLAETILGWIEASGLDLDELDHALVVHGDLVRIHSLDPTSAVLGVILRSSTRLVEEYRGLFFVSDELRTFCSEADGLPQERLVRV